MQRIFDARNRKVSQINGNTIVCSTEYVQFPSKETLNTASLTRGFPTQAPNNTESISVSRFHRALNYANYQQRST